MALELQNYLHDSNGARERARELLFKAVKHCEEHGLGHTLENAQTQVDLARNLSKTDRLSDAEKDSICASINGSTRDLNISATFYIISEL